MNRYKGKRIICLLFIASIIIFSSLCENVKFGSLNIFRDTKGLEVKNSGFWALTGSPIYIDDTDPANNWAVTVVTNEWCSGYGNSTHPYIIEDIVMGLSGTGNCIEILNSEAYFIIENCSLYDADHAIELSNVSNGQISGNEIFDQDIESVYLTNNCHNCSIINNNFIGITSVLAPDIYLTSSNNCSIRNNTIFSNKFYGIGVSKSNNTIIYDNKVNVSKTGIWINKCDNVNLTFNKINVFDPNFAIAIYFSEARNCTLNLNNFTNCGLFLSGDEPQYYRYHKIDYSNKVNNRSIYYNISSSNLYIQEHDNPGQIILVDCNHSLISDLNLSDSSIGIHLMDCNNITMHNITSNSNYAGVLIENTNHSVLSRHALSNSLFGLALRQGVNNTIANSTITLNSFYGIDLDSYSISNNFYGNHFENNSDNVECDNSQNSWNSTFIGNYWDDFTGVDANDDNVGDTPHVDTNIQDYLPIWWDAAIISIINPSNHSFSKQSNLNFCIQVQEGLGNYTWYDFIETGNSSTYIELNGTIDEVYNGTFNQDLLTNGTKTIRFYVNDSRGYIGFKDLILHIDIFPPFVNVILPIGGIFSTTPPNFTVHVVDDNLNINWYELNVEDTKHLFTNNESIDQTAWSSLPDGLVNITFYVNDSAGNVHFLMVQVYKDTDVPLIIDNQEDVVQYYGGRLYDVDFFDSNPLFNISYIQYTIYNDTGQNGTRYLEWTNISTNIRANNFTEDWTIDFSKCHNGKNYISVRVYDEAGNFKESIDVFIIIKAGPPQINPLRDFLLMLMIGLPLLFISSILIYNASKYLILRKIDASKRSERKKKLMMRQKQKYLSLADKHLSTFISDESKEIPENSSESITTQSKLQPAPSTAEEKGEAERKIETTSISIICPICKTNKTIIIPKPIIDKAKQLTAVSIAKGIVCEHHFQAFVDKNFVVRGYQKIDFHL